MITISVCLPTRWRWHSPGVCVPSELFLPKSTQKLIQLSPKSTAYLRVVYSAETTGYVLDSEVICHTPEGGESNGENCRTGQFPHSGAAESLACVRLRPCFQRQGCHAAFLIRPGQLLQQSNTKPQRLAVLRCLQR